jgi:hypothetical protein
LNPMVSNLSILDRGQRPCRGIAANIRWCVARTPHGGAFNDEVRPARRGHFCRRCVTPTGPSKTRSLSKSRRARRRPSFRRAGVATPAASRIQGDPYRLGGEREAELRSCATATAARTAPSNAWSRVKGEGLHYPAHVLRGQFGMHPCQSLGPPHLHHHGMGQNAGLDPTPGSRQPVKPLRAVHRC